MTYTRDVYGNITGSYENGYARDQYGNITGSYRCVMCMET
jgi:hypothetical protein